MNITPELVVSGVTVMTLLGSVGGYILHLKDAAQALQLETQSKEVIRLDASVKATWAQIDKLKADGSNYWTRADGEKMRDGFKADMSELGTRMIAEIDKVSTKLSHDMDRFIEVFKNK